MPADTHETREAPQRAPNPLGNGGGGALRTLDLAGDAPLRTKVILERFRRNTRLRLKDGVQDEYARAFRRFAAPQSGEKPDGIGLGPYTKRQLAGRKGKDLLLSHLERIPKPSRRWLLAALKSVWIHGLELPWPIDPKRDIGKLPRTRRRPTPPDPDVLAWPHAAREEKDPYLRLLLLMELQYGWRPGNQLAALRWGDVQYDPDGTPVAIEADAMERDFKSDSDIRAWLWPDVRDALVAWKAASPEVSPDRPILPWHGTTDRLDPGRPHTGKSVLALLRAIARKWGLPHLTPVDFRHFVATALRRAGLSLQASAHLMGHDPTLAGGLAPAMRDVYDNPRNADIYAEQSAMLPRGPLGILEPPEVQVDEELPPEALAALKDFLAGRLGVMEMALRLEALQRKSQEPVLRP